MTILGNSFDLRALAGDGGAREKSLAHIPATLWLAPGALFAPAASLFNNPNI